MEFWRRVRQRPAVVTTAVAGALALVFLVFGVVRLAARPLASPAARTPPSAASPSAAARLAPSESATSAPRPPTSPTPAEVDTTGPATRRASTPMTTGSAAPTTSAPRGGVRSVSVVEWLVKFAPGGSGESRLDAYLAFLNTDCEELIGIAGRLDGVGALRDLYLSAGHACRAAFRGVPAAWSDAMAGFERLGQADAELFECFDFDARTALASLIELHVRFPDAEIRRPDGTARPTTTCPRITTVEPSHGPMAGGQEVVITGENLPDPVVVEFGAAVAATVPVRDGTEAVVTVPPADSPGEQPIAVEGFYYASNPYYTYDDAPTSRE